MSEIGKETSTDPVAPFHLDRLSLRTRARLREVDRQLYRIEITRQGLKWVGIPGLIVVFGMALPSVLGAGITLTQALTGSGMLLAGLGGFRVAFSNLSSKNAALESARDHYLAQPQVAERTLLANEETDVE